MVEYRQLCFNAYEKFFHYPVYEREETIEFIYTYAEPEHFPCGKECDYCDLVRGAMYELRYDYEEPVSELYLVPSRSGLTKATYIATGKRIGHAVGDIISYKRYMELPDYCQVDSDNIIWTQCRGCYTVVVDALKEKFDGYCSVVCEHRFNDYDDDDEDIGYMSEVDRCTGVSAGEIIPRSQYSRVGSCWIDHNGSLLAVPNCAHENVARMLGYRSASIMKGAGFIHVSTFWDIHHRFRFIPERPTRAQFKTMIELCDALKHVYPSVLLQWITQESGIEQKVVNHTWTYSVLQSCLPRRMRDLFYALSGD